MLRHENIVMEENNNPEQPAQHYESRRGFLKLAVAASAILAVGGISAVTQSVTAGANQTGSTTTSSTSFPKVKIAALTDVTLNTPIPFNYPLDTEPNILVKIGQKAEGGIGPDGDIVAFSQVCQHLGCLYAYQSSGTSPLCNSSYKAQGPEGYCCCHGSIYDFASGGKVIGGPAPRNIPQVIIELDSDGNIYATGMKPPTVFGHSTGSNDVTADLQGGNLVQS